MPTNNADFTPTIDNSTISPSIGAYKATGSFRFWAQKVLPLVYDDSLSYYELLCKVVNYLNDVIENVDTLNDSVNSLDDSFGDLQNYVNATKDELISTYNELQSYVNNYFDSLDIQDEINNKLDVMASDGTLIGIISPIVPDIVTDWLDNNITPTTPIVDATLTISGAAADAKVTGDKLNEVEGCFINNLFDNTDPTYIANAYVNSTGEIIEVTSYFISNHIPVSAGESFVSTYINSNGATPVRVYRADGTKIANVTGVVSDDNKYLSFTIPSTLANAAYMTINGRTFVTEYMVIRGDMYPDFYVDDIALAPNIELANNDDFENLNDTINGELDTLNNKLNTVNNIFDIVYAGEETIPITVGVERSFVNATQNRVDPHNSFNISGSIELIKGQTLSFTAKGYSTTTGMICLYDADTDTYTTVVTSIDGEVRDYRYTATSNCFVRCSYNRSIDPVAVIISSENASAVIEEIQSEIEALKNTTDNQIQYPQLFDNILCIGDSLTVGYDGSGDTPITKNYPHFFKKLADAETTIRGHGGYTAKQVWDSYISASTDLANYDCTIIYLGTNGGLTDTVETDCNANDYTQNADTNTGCYGKIIGKIKADAPNCKIFCVAGPNEYVDRTERNEVIREIATLYNVGIVDIEDSILSDDGSSTSVQRYRYRPIDGIHYNALGYLTFANLIYDRMGAYMEGNLNNFA